MQSSSFGRKFRNDVFICHSSYFFFLQNLAKPADIHAVAGRKEGEHNFPGAKSLSYRRITSGSTE